MSINPKTKNFNQRRNNDKSFSSSSSFKRGDKRNVEDRTLSKREGNNSGRSRDSISRSRDSINRSRGNDDRSRPNKDRSRDNPDRSRSSNIKDRNPNGRSWIPGRKNSKHKYEDNKESSVENNTKKIKNPELNNFKNFENKFIMTSRKPSKQLKLICTHLRNIFKPNSLHKIEDFSGDLKGTLIQAKKYMLSHIIVCNENSISIGWLENKKTYKFELIEYTNNFTTFSNEYYNDLPLVTVFNSSPENSREKYSEKSIKSEDSSIISSNKNLTKLFNCFGTKKQPFKRLLQIYLEDDLVYIRHFTYYVNDIETNYKVQLREIGPRLTLKLISEKNGLFKENLWKTQY